jgi:hypothetical protein
MALETVYLEGDVNERIELKDNNTFAWHLFCLFQRINKSNKNDITKKSKWVKKRNYEM